MPRVDIDVGVEERLGELIKQSFAIAYDRGTLSGMAAGRRTLHPKPGKASKLAPIMDQIRGQVPSPICSWSHYSSCILPSRVDRLEERFVNGRTDERSLMKSPLFGPR